MYALRCLAVAAVSAFSLFSSSYAHSTQRNPLTYLTRVENAVVHTPSHRAHSQSKFDLTFELHSGEQEVKLSLSPNHAVIQEGASIQYLAPDGSIRSSEPIDRSQHRVFRGHTWVKTGGGEWQNRGWARITVLQDGKTPLFEGAFRLDGDHHHIKTRSHFMQTRHKMDPTLEASDEEYMVAYRDSDIGTGFVEDNEGLLHDDLKRSIGGPTCSSDGLSFNNQPDHPVFRALKRDDRSWGAVSTKSIFGRQIDGQTGGNSAGINLLDHIGSTDGCPSTRRVALVGVATDCTYTAAFNSTESARANIIQVINAASVQYEDSFNITLGLKNLTISDANCPATPAESAPWNVACSDSVSIQDRLNLFSAWRGDRPDNNAFWTLLSTCETGSAVGLAWLGQVCVATAQVATSSTGNETISGANVVVRTSEEWQVVAHEVGHTFGAVHDCNAQSCGDGNTVNAQQCCPFSTTQCDAGQQFIMNPSTGPNIQKFSPCSIGNICTAIGRNSVRTQCLAQNKDVQTITGSQCGNGIVESGEDCDCGGESGCSDNACCDAATCKFKNNAVCDPSNEDCCNNSCQFAGSGTVCRASTGTCDPQETCSGNAAACPEDTTAPDGQSCGNASGLFCASGQCTSRSLQCKTLMGSYTSNNDTYSCSNSGCQISCASPQFGQNVCYSVQQNFLDGTGCQGGGRCSNGQCQGASVAGEISSWMDTNKMLVIGLASGIGGLIVLSIVACCFSRYKRKKRTKTRAKIPSQQPGWAAGNQWRGSSYAHPPASYQQGNQRGSQANPPWNQNAHQASWQPSIRYA